MPNVLVVDDDPVSRYLLNNILTHLGHVVCEAPDGRSAIHLFRLQRHDIVMLDMLMPEKDGFETLFDLRNIDREAKVIMMTGGGRMTINLFERLSDSLRVPHLLTKPFVVEVVRRVIADLLAAPNPAEPGKSAPVPVATARQQMLEGLTKVRPYETESSA